MTGGPPVTEPPYGAEQIARVCHEANRELQRIQADPGVSVAPAWDECTQETRDSAVAGVQIALGGASPEQLHETWSAFKREHGWVYGPVKDEAAKTHPCLVPYRDLPVAQRVKDFLFRGIVGALGGIR